MPSSDAGSVYAISDRYVEELAALDPNTATGAGIAGHDHELTDLSPAGRRWSLADLVPNLLAGNPHPSSDAAPRWHFLDFKDGPALLDERNDAVEGRAELKAWKRGDTPSVFVNTADQPVSVWTSLPPRTFFAHPGPEGPVALAWIAPADGFADRFFIDLCH